MTPPATLLLPEHPEALRPANPGAEIPQQLSRLLTTIRRHLHMHPELGFAEYQTAQFIREMLEMHGLEVQGPVAETGLFVDIQGEQPGPFRGYRADIDALPIQDAKQVSYASQQEGIAHLCGHDAHTAIGIGVALLLHGLRQHLRGKVRVFFQPNEEGPQGGAPAMIHDGILDGLEAVYAIHTDPTLATGVFGLLEGPITAAADRFRVRVSTQSTGHSARPHETVDTVWVANQIASALYQLTGRVTDARNASVLAICRFHAGHADNVIPAEAEFSGTLRSTDLTDREQLHHLITRTAEHIANLYRADCDVNIEVGAPPVLNAGPLIGHLRRSIHRLYGPAAVYDIPRPSMGSEDFAYYLEHVPGALLRVGTSASPETSYPLHDAHFDLDEEALAPAARLMAHVLLHHAQHPENS